MDIDVVDIDCSPTDADAIAEINIQYQRAEITKMYHLSHIFYGISSLNDLKTNNKNSFLAAVNEISTKLTTEISDRMDENDSLSDRINTETGERQAADMQLSARINAIGNKAPTNHASGATTYGVGNASNYGHLKLSDSTTSTSSTGSGIAATPKAVKTISDTLSTEISDRQAADDELKGKIKYGELERRAIIEDINELVSGKVGVNDIVNGKDASYRVTDLLKWVAELKKQAENK